MWQGWCSEAICYSHNIIMIMEFNHAELSILCYFVLHFWITWFNLSMRALVYGQKCAKKCMPVTKFNPHHASCNSLHSPTASAATTLQILISLRNQKIISITCVIKRTHTEQKSMIIDRSFCEHGRLPKHITWLAVHEQWDSIFGNLYTNKNVLASRRPYMQIYCYSLQGHAYMEG
jgi:hypothetical protein